VVVTDGDVEIRDIIPLSPDGERGRFCHLRKDYFDPLSAPEAPRHRGNQRLTSTNSV
jgi:hypothetical protein